MTTVRKTARADAPAILRLAAAEPLFSREDREVVDELLAGNGREESHKQIMETT